MHLFWRSIFFYSSIGIEKSARKVEKMFESHCSLRWFETCFLRVSSVDDNGVTKFREVVSHGSVESEFALLDQYQGSQLTRSDESVLVRLEDKLTEVISLVWLQSHITLSGPTSLLEGSPATLGPPPLKYISSSRFDTPYTKPGIFFSTRAWAYINRSITLNFQIQSVEMGAYN